MADSTELSAGAVLQMIDVARRHLVDDEPFTDIARSTGLSRFKVARLTKEARSRGFVQVNIHPPGTIDLAGSDTLRTAWAGLDEAIVVPTPAAEDTLTLRDALAAAAASTITDRVTADDVLGLACGRTVNRMASFITALPSCSIVQLTGVTSNSMADSSIRTMQQVAALSRGRAFPIYAPMFLDAPPLVEAMMKEPAIAAATSRFGSLTHAVVTVGGWNAAESTMFPLVPDGMRRRLADLGVVAEFNGHLLNDAGEDVGTEFTRRCITISLKDMTDTPGLLVVAGGPGRRIALRAALRGGLIRRLITDSDTAAWLAAQP